ncbi:MAG: S1C family serine protease [Clostridia bacterium]|nr:S1C family serine protease [Clostridia bacterium]
MKKKGLYILVIIAVIATMAICLCACNKSGEDGLSAYELAVQEGFEGTLSDWLDSLNGMSGEDGLSAYRLAVSQGYDGTLNEWLASLNGRNGRDGATLSIEEVYDAAVNNGYQGDFLTFLKEYLNTDIKEECYGVSKGLVSSVSISAEFHVTTSGYFGQQTKVATSGGSGVIYRIDKAAGSAYIITNHHVIYYSAADEVNGISTNIKVYLYGKEYSDDAISATYIGSSSTYDIAVLKIDNSDVLRDSDCVAVSVRDSEDIAVGERVNAIGNAAGGGISVTEGVLSVDSETITISDSGISQSYRVMRVDAAINSGNSGGGLFDYSGKLIGIVNAKYSSDTIENIGYAIPSNIAVGVADNIIDNCDGESNTAPSVFRLGIGVAIADSKAVYDESSLSVSIKEVVTVKEVTASSAADGKLAQGDILLSVSAHGNVVEINRTFSLIDALLNVRAGDKVILTVERGGENVTVDITAEAQYFVLKN